MNKNNFDQKTASVMRKERTNITLEFVGWTIILILLLSLGTIFLAFKNMERVTNSMNQSNETITPVEVTKPIIYEEENYTVTHILPDNDTLEEITFSFNNVEAGELEIDLEK